MNLKDEDGETCLFVAETVEVAQCLVHELHIDLRIRNEDGMDALEKFESEQEFPDVADYLRARTSHGSMEGGAGAPTTRERRSQPSCVATERLHQYRHRA